MAALYAAYAQTGMFGASLPVFTGAEKAALAAKLAAVFSLPAPNPAAFGTAWSTGLTAFWLTPPIVVTGVQSGAVTALAGGATVSGVLAAIGPSNLAPVAASKVASALHTATLTCIATVAPPPGTLVTIL